MTQIGRGARLALGLTAASVAGTVALVGPAAAAPASSVDWDAIAKCESGGNWSINTGNGYHGGLQFSPRTWRAHGGGKYASTANRASRAEQIRIAERVLDTQGIGAWPTCGRKARATKRHKGADGVTASSTRKSQNRPAKGPKSTAQKSASQRTTAQRQAARKTERQATRKTERQAALTAERQAALTAERQAANTADRRAARTAEQAARNAARQAQARVAAARHTAMRLPATPAAAARLTAERKAAAMDAVAMAAAARAASAPVAGLEATAMRVADGPQLTAHTVDVTRPEAPTDADEAGRRAMHVAVTSVRAAAAPATGTDYVVRSGDTLAVIAMRNSVQGGWQALYRLNREKISNPDRIFTGQRLDF